MADQSAIQPPPDPRDWFQIPVNQWVDQGPLKAQGAQNVIWLAFAKPQLSVFNPDTYVAFATAMHQSQFDWAVGFAQ